MRLRFHRKLYREFLRFERIEFVEDLKHCPAGSKLSESLLAKIYDAYHRPTFVEFLNTLRSILFCELPNVLGERNELWNRWDLFYVLKFLTESQVVEVKRGRVRVLDHEVEEGLLRPLRKGDLIRVLRRRFRRIKLGLPTSNLFRLSLDWKLEYDQDPITLGSAIHLVERIADWFPLTQDFLFVGDDDLISILLGIAVPGMRVTVVDVDGNLLDQIDGLASMLGLELRTKQVDVRKSGFKARFKGFLTNPPYTFLGVRSFVRFGVSTFGKDGGVGFVVFGDYDIGWTRYLWLQQFFARNGLVIDEVAPKCVAYPRVRPSPDESIIGKRLESIGVCTKVTSTASLYVLSYVPWSVRRLGYRQDMYSYV
jgi:hypothetical protein